jgi:histidinol-phosphate aminotransferase
VNELSQQRALNRLLDIDKVNLEVTDLLRQRTLLYKVLLEVNFIQKVYPSDANFILVKVDDATRRYNQLIEKGVVIRNRTTQPLCENTLRFTVGTKEENEKLIEALKSLD